MQFLKILAPVLTGAVFSPRRPFFWQHAWVLPTLQPVLHQDFLMPSPQSEESPAPSFPLLHSYY